MQRQGPDAELQGLTDLLRRVVAARIDDPSERQDIVQEAIARTLAVRPRLAGDVVAPYAVTVAKNLAIAHYARRDLERRHRHRLIDLTEPGRPEDLLVADEDALAMRAAIAALPAAERQVLIGHVIDGDDTAALAKAVDSTAGGVAARLARARARARVEYVLTLRRQTLPSPQCRPVLLAVSAADRRRQQAISAADHLVSCGVCASLVVPLAERRSALAGLLPLPLLLVLPRLRQQGRSAQLTAAGGVGVLAVGAAAVVAGLPAVGHNAPQASPATLTTPVGQPAPAVQAPTPTATYAVSRPAVPSSSTVTGEVDDVPAAYGFWMRIAGRDTYVHFSGLPARQVRLGDKLGLRSTRMLAVTPSLLDDSRAVEPGDRARVKAARTYLAVAAKDIAFLASSG